MFVGAQTTAPVQRGFKLPASTAPQEFIKTAFRTPIALFVAALASACASPGDINAAPASSGVSNMVAPAPMAAMEPRIMAMQNMHQKMMGAKTPEERQALMAEYMKAMQGGMAMMKDMQGMQGMGASSGVSGMGNGIGTPAEVAKRHQMTSDRMAAMQMMMAMMADRMPAAPAAQ